MTLAFLFPGQGAQKVGMGQALAAAHPIARETFAEADRVLGFGLTRLCAE
ncbi:MAG: malonyl CoA-acyl carrier protein transacylase, partial [Candidatus Eisenbacteria bacterium]|nr:malonyl CoA-acyl carrier protein transacylase [Candidatus Eisenbacteria bacterium]